MKRFISGVAAGVLISSTVAFAATYTAHQAGFKILVNGKEFTSDPPPLVVEGRTYLPLRAIGDALGVPVEWNAELQQAEVGANLDVDPVAVQNYIIEDVWNKGFWFLGIYIDGSYVYYNDMYIADFADSHDEEFNVNKIIEYIKSTKSTMDAYNSVFSTNGKWQAFYAEYNRLYDLAISGKYNADNYNTTFFVKVMDEFCNSLQ